MIVIVVVMYLGDILAVMRTKMTPLLFVMRLVSPVCLAVMRHDGTRCLTFCD